MKWLVTGGAGFIGSNFLYYLRGQYPTDQLVCVDKLTYAGNLSTLKGLMSAESPLSAPGFHFYQEDICDRDRMFAVFETEKPDVVVHFAAESHVDRSIDAPDVFLKTNVLGTGVLLDACRAFGGIRFHQVSTDEVYGDLPLDRPDLFLPSRRRFIPAAPIPPPRPGRTCWCRPTGAPTACR